MLDIREIPHLLFQVFGLYLAAGLLVAGDASAANLLTNGSFEAGLSPWTFSLANGVQGIQYQDGGTHTDGNWSEAIQAGRRHRPLPGARDLARMEFLFLQARL